MSEIPLPVVTELTSPYWQACRTGTLTAQRCSDCGRVSFPPEAFCTFCLSPDLDWVPSTGLGVLRSYSVVWRASLPAFQTPYLAAIVELDERWAMFSNLIDCPIEEATIGMRVGVKFVEMSSEITLPYFAPVVEARSLGTVDLSVTKAI